MNDPTKPPTPPVSPEAAEGVSEMFRSSPRAPEWSIRSALRSSLSRWFGKGTSDTDKQTREEL